MRILIAVPTFESIRPETFKSIYGLDPAGNELLFDYVKGYDCARARNLIANETLEGGFDAVLMVDSDIVLPRDALKLMCENSPLLGGPADVVLGAYPRRFDMEGSELFSNDRYDFTDENRIRFRDMPRGRFACKGGGLGCALVRAHVFETWPHPWFKYVEYDPDTVLSEDNFFCFNAAQQGNSIEGDGRVRCGHIGASAIYGSYRG